MAGLVNVISGLTPSVAERVHLVAAGLTPDVRQLAHGATAVLGLALILLARGLAHRRRLAFSAAIILLGVSVITHVAKGLDIEESVMMLVVAGLLIRSRKLFTEPTPRARWQSLLLWIPIVVVFDFAYGLLGLALRHDRVQPALTLPLALHEISARLLGLVGPLHLQGGFGHWFPISITVLGVLSIVAIGLIALAPVAEQVGLHHHEARSRVRPLCDRADGDTLDPFALRQDKSYVFSADGCRGTRVPVHQRHRTRVRGSDRQPGGVSGSDRARSSSAVTRTVGGPHRSACATTASRSGRTPGCGRTTSATRRSSTSSPSRSTAGRCGRSARRPTAPGTTGSPPRSCGKVSSSPDLRAALVAIADRHRNGEPERGFSMALDGLLSGRDPQCVVIVARDENGTAIAFQRYVPCKNGARPVDRRDAPGRRRARTGSTSG